MSDRPSAKEKELYFVSAKKLYSQTVYTTNRFPKSWDEPYCRHLREAAHEVAVKCILANSVYIGTGKPLTEDHIKAFEERIQYLYEALRYLKVFNIEAELLLSNIDFSCTMLETLETAISRILREHDNVQGVTVQIDGKFDFVFHSIAGREEVKLPATDSVIKRLIQAKIDTEDNIRKRINSDRAIVKSFRSCSLQ